MRFGNPSAGVATSPNGGGNLMSRRWWFALLPLLFVHSSFPAQVLREAVPSDESRAPIEKSLWQGISVDFQATPLSEVIAVLQSKIEVPIVVDEVALEKEEISLDQPITTTLDNVTAKSTLHLLLRQVHLGWVIADGKVKITTEQRAKGEPVWRTHPVSDMLVSAEGSADDQVGDELLNFVFRTVDPWSWKGDYGFGEMQCWLEDGMLWVYQTLDAHDQLDHLLGAIRRSACTEVLQRDTPVDQ
jgi:hypothetical protein